MFKSGEAVLLESKRITYEYACVSQYPWHMKNVINRFFGKRGASIIMLKMVSGPLHVWKEVKASHFLMFVPY